MDFLIRQKLYSSQEAGIQFSGSLLTAKPVANQSKMEPTATAAGNSEARGSNVKCEYGLDGEHGSSHLDLHDLIRTINHITNSIYNMYKRT